MVPIIRILENERVVPGTLPLISLLLTANGLDVHLVSKEKFFRNYFGSKIPRLVPRRRITRYNPFISELAFYVGSSMKVYGKIEPLITLSTILFISESAVYGGSSIKVYGACQTT